MSVVLWIIVGILIGALTIFVVLPALFLIGLKFFVRRAMKSAEGDAAMVQKQLMDYLTGEDEYVQLSAADLDDFEDYDREFYDATAAALESLGFRRLWDLENRLLTRSFGRRTAIRTLYLPGEGIGASIYSAGGEAVIDLESDLSNDEWIITNNSRTGSFMEPPPGIHPQSVDPETPAAGLLDHHRKRLAEYLSARPGVTAREDTTWEGCLAAAARQKELQRKQRLEMGGITAEEFMRVASKHEFDDEDMENLSEEDREDAREQFEGIKQMTAMAMDVEAAKNREKYRQD